MISLNFLIYIIFISVIDQLNAVPKFNEIWLTDLKSNNVSFQKYDQKLIILYKMSPLFNKPNEQIRCLNDLFDKYHQRGMLNHMNIFLLYLIFFI